MKIAIRVDASNEIGTGHFIRCMTLADALKKRGAAIRFVSRSLPEHLQDLVRERGHQLCMLDAAVGEVSSGTLRHASWLSTSQEKDATDTLKVLSGQVWDWLVVDHYALDVNWERALQHAAHRVFVIDDIADRNHDCDLLLDQNFYTDMDSRYRDKVPAHCQLLLGPRYALLRDEFQELRLLIKPCTGLVRRALIFFGGVDNNNNTAVAIRAIASLEIAELEVDVVIGARHPRIEYIKSLCEEHGYACHVQTDQMATLMAAADISVGAGGTATWERCCLGVPTLVISTADNQRDQISDAASQDLVFAPVFTAELEPQLREYFGAFVENSILRAAISRSCMHAVDGKGVWRVIEGLGYGDIAMRMAKPDDSAKLFEWRNHPTIRIASRNHGLIDWGTHQSWFASVLGSLDKLLLIGESDGSSVGVVRFEIHGHEAEVSIYLVPDGGFTGRGRGLLQCAERWIAVNRPDIAVIRAHVLVSNERSHRLFLGLGYTMESEWYSKEVKKNDDHI